MKLNKTYVEDCLATMARMPDEFVDLVVTSPPYDDLRDYTGEAEWNLDVFKKVAEELFRVIKQGGVVVWVTNDATIDGSETGTSFKHALGFKETGFNLHDTMIYEKAGCSMPSPNRYLSSFEYMFIFSKGKPKTFNPIEDRKNRFPERWGKGRKVRNKDGSFSHRDNYIAKEYGRRFNIWRYSGGLGYGTKDKIAYEHPAIFPEKLAQDHIISWSNEGELVYDPFMGSGTTAKMSHLLKRNWIGSEVAEKYKKIADKRIEPYISQKTLF